MRAYLVLLSLVLVFTACQAEKPTSPQGSSSGVGVSATSPPPGSGSGLPDAAPPVEGAIPLQTAPEKVTFPKGFNSVTLRGRVAEGSQAVYLVNLTAGDILSARIVESNPNNDVVFNILSPFKHYLVGGDAADKTTKWEAKLAETGEFKIMVGAIETRDSPFTLELRVK